MKLNEMDLIGKQSPSLDSVAKKHKMSVTDMSVELDRGIEVEYEHTNDRREAREIALDHLWELPDYYKRLKQVEK